MARKFFKAVPNVYLVFKEGDKYLLQFRSTTVDYEAGQYCVVAGHVEGNETIREAAKREAEEEIGVVIELDDLKVCHVVHRLCSDQERIDFFIKAKKWQGQAVIKEPDKCVNLDWFNISDFPENTVPRIIKAIKNIEKGVLYSEYGWENDS